MEKEKELTVELKLDCRYPLNGEEWGIIVYSTAATIDKLEKAHGHNRTQYKIILDNRES